MRGKKNLQGKERLKAAFRSGCPKKLALRRKRPNLWSPHSKAARCGDQRGSWGGPILVATTGTALANSEGNRRILTTAQNWLQSSHIVSSSYRGMELSLPHRTRVRVKCTHGT